MIGYLKGKVILSNKTNLILDVSNVGYLIHTPVSVALGEDLQLFIHTHVTENSISLFGFANTEQLDFFKQLIKVSGVGPKLAIVILQNNSKEDLSSAIKDSNVSFFTAIPGIGKKTAQKIILELKNKISSEDLDLSSLDQNTELAQALTGLGFKKGEIGKIFSKINPQDSLEEQIKQSLRLIR